MKVPVAIILTLLIATPAMAVDIVSGSGAVVKNGAGLTVINGDPCSGRLDAACFDRDGDRRNGPQEVIEAAVEPEPQDEKPENDCEGECEAR